jgi:hypothetical protein
MIKKTFCPVFIVCCCHGLSTPNPVWKLNGDVSTNQCRKNVGVNGSDLKFGRNMENQKSTQDNYTTHGFIISSIDYKLQHVIIINGTSTDTNEIPPCTNNVVSNVW